MQHQALQTKVEDLEKTNSIIVESITSIKDLLERFVLGIQDGLRDESQMPTNQTKPKPGSQRAAKSQTSSPKLGDINIMTEVSD